MKKINAFFYVFLTIIAASVSLFLFLEKGEKLRIVNVIQRENTLPISDDFGFIYEEMINHTALTNQQLDYEIKFLKNTSDIEEQLKDLMKVRTSNVIVCDFEKEETYEVFETLNAFPSSLYITLYEGGKLNHHTNTDVLNLFPPTDLLAEAINRLFNLNDDHYVLTINNKNKPNKNDIFQSSLKGKNSTMSIDEEEEIKITISAIGETLSIQNPDYIIIDLNEQITIALLERIVGYPRDRIILLTENTSERVGYYTGSNAYGMHGITFSNPSQVKGYNNQNSLLKMIAQPLAQSFKKTNQVGTAQLKQYLKENPNTPFRLLDNQLVTPFYKVSFSEKGLRVITKLELQK